MLPIYPKKTCWVQVFLCLLYFARESSCSDDPEYHGVPSLLYSSDVSVNETNDFILGFSNDPFGDKTIPPNRSNRRKRSVVHLYNMVQCATGCNPLAYKGYGCYCGFLGSGYTVDGIDRCCQMHDWCYDSTGCPMFLEYFVPYLWKCYHRQPLCGIEVGSHGSCGQRLCHCDQLLAQCLRRYPCPSTKAICTSSPWRLLQNIFML